MSEQTMQGNCLCGAVEISTSNLNQKIGACHCGMCRKWGGSSLLVVDLGSEVKFTGEDEIQIYDSSEWGERGFCGKCGTHLFYRFKQNNQYYVPVGIFSNRQDFVFDHQIFIDRKPEYYSFADNTHNMTEAEVMKMFAEQGSEA